MAQAHATVDRIAAWNDGAGNEWREELPAAVRSAASVAIEPDQMPPPVRTYLDQLVGKDQAARRDALAGGNAHDQVRAGTAAGAPRG